MRVVFVHTDFRIYWPARLVTLHDFLQLREIELCVIEIAGAGSPYEFEKGNNNHPGYWHCLFPNKRMEAIRPGIANKAVRKKLDELSPDLVFSGAIAYPSGAASGRWAMENGKRCVIFDNARLIDVPRRAYVNFYKKRVFAGVDAIICPAPAWNETFRFFGFDDQRIFYGLNVVDNSFWSIDHELSVAGLPERYFLGVGRQILKKNFIFLLNAYLAYTKGVENPAGLVLVGNGPRRSVLEEFLKMNNLKNVHFMDFCSQEILRTIYSNALCFILPSRYGETWGLVVNEAMASGLPVIVSNQAGCASTLVLEGVNGFTFSPDRLDELSGLMLLIEKLIPNKLSDMGQKSREVINQWGLDRFCSGVYDTIQFVIENPRSKPGFLSRISIRLWKGRYRPL